jgi:hypothetical protein
MEIQSSRVQTSTAPPPRLMARNRRVDNMVTPAHYLIPPIDRYRQYDCFMEMTERRHTELRITFTSQSISCSNQLMAKRVLGVFCNMRVITTCADGESTHL